MTNENKSLTDIVNSALVQIGDSPIKDIGDENDGRAKISRILIKQCIAEVESHSSSCWEELIEDEELTLRSKADGIHAFEYNAPLGILSIFGVYNRIGKRIDYRFFGGKIHTETEAKYVRFVRYNENPDAWSPELKSCVIGLLSAKLIGAIMKDIGGSRQMVETFWQTEFKRFSGNRVLNGNRSRKGADDDFRRYYDDSEEGVYRGLSDSSIY